MCENLKLLTHITYINCPHHLTKKNKSALPAFSAGHEFAGNGLPVHYVQVFFMNVTHSHTVQTCLCHCAPQPCLQPP